MSELKQIMNKTKLKLKITNRNKYFRYNGSFELIRAEYQKWYDGHELIFAFINFRIVIQYRRFTNELGR